MRRLLLAAVLAAAAPAFGMGKHVTHQVLAFSGDVRVWLPYSARWRRIHEGQHIPANALVVVGERSMLTYENLDEAEHSDVVTITAPLTFRIGSHEIRPLKITSHFLDKMPHLDPDQLDPDSDLPVSLKQAWQRDLALLKPSEENAAAMAAATKAGDEQKVTLEAGSDSLRVIAPKDKAVLVAQGVPHPITVSWRGHGRTRPPYVVSMWRAGDLPKVVAKTDEEEQTIAIPEFGDYTISVQSVGEGKAGAPALVHVSVMPSLAERLEARKDALKDGQKTTAAIQALNVLRLVSALPPRGFTTVAAHLPYHVEIAWTEERPLPKAAVYRLECTDDQGRPLFAKAKTLASIQPYFELDLPHYGAYRWRVSTVGEPSATAKTRERPVLQTSRWREINVAPGADAAFKLARTGVLYLGE